MIQLHCPTPLLSIVMSGFVCVVACADHHSTSTSVAQSVEALIEDLGHDQYHRRQAAKRDLIELANEGSADGLSQGLKHTLLEVRSSVSEILSMVRQQEFARDLDRLSNPNYPIDQVTSVGWKQFDEVAGTDKEARWAFVAICRQHPSAFASLELIKSKHAEFTNPFQLSVDDHVGWMILLLPAMNPTAGDGKRNELDSTEATQISRIAMSLSQTSMGLDLQTSDDHADWLGLVFGRIVTHWINRHHSIIDPRTAMRVAVRYQCNQAAMEIAHRTLRDRASTASAKVTAMLTLSKLQATDPMHDRRNILESFTSDDRTAHVWQAISDRKIKIQTQVRDVAIAMMLDQAKQDPRQFGFAYLEADPLLRFRDYSLGFASQSDRETSHAAAIKFLEASRRP